MAIALLAVFVQPVASLPVDARDVKVRVKNCTTDDKVKVYSYNNDDKVCFNYYAKTTIDKDEYKSIECSDPLYHKNEKYWYCKNTVTTQGSNCS